MSERQWYNQYEDPNCPDCDCADWGMMYCSDNCTREKYIQQKRKEYEQEYERERTASQSQDPIL